MRTFELSFPTNERKELNLRPSDHRNELSILWNIGGATQIGADAEEIHVDTNCIVFVSEFFMEINSGEGNFRLIQFEKAELSPFDDVSDMVEYLMMFYGVHSLSALPKITLTESQVPDFKSIWNQLTKKDEMPKEPVSVALKRNSLQRFLLLSQQIHMETEFDIPIDFNDMKIIREFQYLVNNNFKELTRVSQYAEVLKVSPKKVAQIFGACYNRKASELIADRRNLYAQRQLRHTNELIKNIAYDLNFSDSQTFSHFFKKQNGISPEEYRSKSN